MTKEEFRVNFVKMLWFLDKKLRDIGLTIQEFQPWFSFDHNFASLWASTAQIATG